MAKWKGKGEFDGQIFDDCIGAVALADYVFSMRKKYPDDFDRGALDGLAVLFDYVNEDIRQNLE
jgi:hypothetical protein